MRYWSPMQSASSHVIEETESKTVGPGSMSLQVWLENLRSEFLERHFLRRIFHHTTIHGWYISFRTPGSRTFTGQNHHFFNNVLGLEIRVVNRFHLWKRYLYNGIAQHETCFIGRRMRPGQTSLPRSF